MLPNGVSVSGFSPANLQQWAVAALSGQPGLANGQTVPMDRLIMESNNMLLNTLAPTPYGRPSHNANNSAPVIPGCTVPSYTHHPSLGGYAFHQPVDPPVAGRQFANPAMTPSYQFQQHYPQPGSASQPISLPHAASTLYAQSVPYISSPLGPALCNGALNHITQFGGQSQATALAAATMAGVTLVPYNSLKHFGALPQNQNRRNKTMITSKTNLYISGLSESDTDDTVRSLVENVVVPKSCKAIVQNGKCKGSGFIDCSSEEDAETAKNHIIELAKTKGLKISVKFAFENEKDQLNVYVKNLPRQYFTKEKLQEMFSDYGQVTSSKLYEPKGDPTGIGFVRFQSAEEAATAVERMNAAGLVIAEDGQPVACKLAYKAEPRRGQNNGSLAAASHFQPHHQQQLSSHLSRQTIGFNNSSSLHTGGIYPSQVPQPSAYGPSHLPLTAPLVPSLPQSHVAVSTVITPNGSPRARGMLSSVSNGGSRSSTMPLNSVFPGNIVSPVSLIGSTASSHRTTTPILSPPLSTPVIGPPVPLVGALAAAAAHNMENSNYAAVLAKVPGVAYHTDTTTLATAVDTNPSLYAPNSCGGLVATPTELNCPPSLTTLGSPSNLQYIQQQIPIPTTVGTTLPNPHVFVLASPTTSYPQQPMTSSHSTNNMPLVAQQHQQTKPYGVQLSNAVDHIRLSQNAPYQTVYAPSTAQMSFSYPQLTETQVANVSNFLSSEMQALQLTNHTRTNGKVVVGVNQYTSSDLGPLASSSWDELPHPAVSSVSNDLVQQQVETHETNVRQPDSGRDSVDKCSSDEATTPGSQINLTPTADEAVAPCEDGQEHSLLKEPINLRRSLSGTISHEVSATSGHYAVVTSVVSISGSPPTQSTAIRTVASTAMGQLNEYTSTEHSTEKVTGIDKKYTLTKKHCLSSAGPRRRSESGFCEGRLTPNRRKKHMSSASSLPITSTEDSCGTSESTDRSDHQAIRPSNVSASTGSVSAVGSNCPTS